MIQLLVSIYDTKDVFVKELQVLLAQRLLAIRDYALEKEVRLKSILGVLTWPLTWCAPSRPKTSRRSRRALANKLYKAARSCSRICKTRSSSMRACTRGCRSVKNRCR